MNESKIPVSRTPSQTSNSNNHLINNNGTVRDVQYNSANRSHTTLHNAEHVKGSQQPLQQYKTVQIISQPNHVMSTAPGNCVFVQQMGNSNHAMSFQQINPQQSNQTTTQGTHMNYRLGSSNPNQNQQHIAISDANNPKSANSFERSQIQVQNPQTPARYTSQVHQLQDGRQVQMIQVNNSAYYQLSSGQNPQQPITLQQYVNVQQQQFMTNNGAQSVLIASQSQDGSRTLQAIPAQIHTIQHTVSPQNQSFQITKAAVKNVKPTNSAGPQIKRNEQIVQVSSNGSQFIVTGQPQGSQGQVFQQFQPQTPVKSPSSRSKPKATPLKATTKNQKSAPMTPIPVQTQQQPSNNVVQNNTKVQQIIIPSRPNTNQDKVAVENKPAPTPLTVRTIHSQSPSVSMPPPPFPVVKQTPQSTVVRHNQPIVIHAPPPPTNDFKNLAKKQANQNRQIRPQMVPPNAYQKPLIPPGPVTTIRPFVVPAVPQQNSASTQAQKATTEQQQKQKIHQILQTATNAQKKLPSAQINSKPISTPPKSTQSSSDVSAVLKNPIIVPVKTQAIQQIRASDMKPVIVPVISQTIIQKQATAVVPTTIPVKTKPLEVKKVTEGISPLKSPVPGDPPNSIVGKLNLDLAVGDPKDSYRVLKKHFKCLVYENECYQGQLRDSHQRLLKLERDNNYLMDRLLKYENLSDSDGEESDSSTKTIEERTSGQKTLKRKPTSKLSIPPPPKKKPNLSKPATSVPNDNTPNLPVVKKENPNVLPQKPEEVNIKTKPTSLISTSSSSDLQKVDPPKINANLAHRTPPSNTGPKRSTPIIQKITSEHAETLKKEGKIVKMISPSSFKMLQTKFDFGNIDDLPSSSAPQTSVASKPIDSVPKPSVTEPNTSSNKPIPTTPVKATPKPTPPKVTVEIKELPLKPSIIKPFDPAKLNDILSKTGNNGLNEFAKTPKVFVPLKFSPRNPTPQSRASISYSAIKSPSVARMMGPRSGPTKMIRPPPMGRFEILSTSPVVQQAAMRAQTPTTIEKPIAVGNTNITISPEKDCSGTKQPQT
uniref:Uncharacterized protein n=1 Tax=Panagrolaimus sp. JU765 TaxID=591449 RepID=A0AC34QAJ9_9BILA